MRVIKKEVDVYDCGSEGCIHIIEAEALSCIARQKVVIRKELTELNMFTHYMGTRQEILFIAKKFNLKTTKTIRPTCIRVMLNFLDSIFSDESVRRYGTDVSLRHASNYHTEMWLRVAKARITQLETYLND